MGVPFLPGVPPLSSYGAVAIGADILLTADSILGGILDLSPQWGFFLDGQPVVTSDNVASFNFKQEFAISDYPTEMGGFASYNKVQIPINIGFRFTTGGSVDARTAMIQSIMAVVGDTNFYQAMTPENTWDSLNFVHWSMNREAMRGNGLLVIDVLAFEVRIGDQANNFQDTAAPSGAAPANNGPQQSSQMGPEGASAVSSGTGAPLNVNDVAAAGGIP